MILAFYFLAVGFFFMVRAIILSSRKQHKQRFANPYIDAHREKMRDDKLYNDYLEFCKLHGELPMDKKGFRDLRSREEDLEMKIKNAIK
ncbi:hypothetical protein QE422_001263 [Chryseobacterium sp. SORGH_AS 447]|uniref:hypothetical protein n=1 Tax=Chryseobacterium sp. SORGH_AS_0447 TaxID=3041769 RepID=UPI00278201BF|nr:hypothetical protein [Chryseobacterium sp. SORGH_AS_0447]MDQ1160895.1 hypothetical protein [Chryseobacterium sp. SORGH_AS_0447]